MMERRSVSVLVGGGVLFWFVFPGLSEVEGLGLREVVGQTVAVKPPAEALKPGVSFRDCDECPEMVVVPGGQFLMGSPVTERERDFEEGPQHEVRIGYAFALGKYEVTFSQWQVCVAAGACPQIADRGWGGVGRPVINVSWEDTAEYVRWLSLKTGQEYRLPNEAEWEYAARGGTTTARYWGAEVGVDKANCHGCSDTFDGEQTTAVGSFEANPFGLHDMLGNVWEWVRDCWNNTYEGAPTDGSAWATGDCRLAVLRGGSWGYFPRSARVASRHRAEREIRLSTNGFRPLRVVTP